MLTMITNPGTVARCWPILLMWIIPALTSCDREVPLAVETIEINGYQIQGRATDRLGAPVPGVEVYVYLDLEFLDNDGALSREFQVTSSQLVTVNVYNSNNTLVRTIVSQFYQPGIIRVDWDQRTAQGTIVPSGLYSVEYIVNGQTRKSYAVVVSGTRTATTDAEGRYVVEDEHLPIGFQPAPIFSEDGSRYFGHHRVAERVAIEFLVDGRIYYFLLRPVKDRVTTVNVTVN